MVENVDFSILTSKVFWLAQVVIQSPRSSAEETALLFSGPQFFVALIAGVVLAFAFQFLLTNFSIAAGISYLGHQADSGSEDNRDGRSHAVGDRSLGGAVRKISFKVGLWTLVTVSIALFFACFLAVRLSLLVNPLLGAIIGLVIWGAYFSLLLWLSSTTVGSLIGSVVNTVTSGFQAMVNTATAALGGKVVSNRMVSTAEAAASAMRRELTAGIDPSNLRDTLEDYLESLRPPELDIKNIRREFETLLHDPELPSLADSDSWKKIDRQTFVDLIRSRSDLSPREVDRLADELEASWKQVTLKQKKQTDIIGELRDYLGSALPEKLRSNELTTKVDQLIAATNKNSQETSQQDSSLANRAMQFATTTLMGIVLGRKDLSDFDVEEILNRLRAVKDRVGEQTGKLANQVSGKAADLAPSIVRSDVENYLLNTYSWQMNPDILEQEFRQVIYDSDADPKIVRQQLESLNRDYFRELLTQRGIFTQSKIAEIADRLEKVRLDVIAKTLGGEIREQVEDLCHQAANYFRTVPATTLLSENAEYDFAKLLENADVEPELLLQVLQRLDDGTLTQVLIQNQDRHLNQQQTREIINLLSKGRDRALEKAQERLASEKSLAQGLQLRLESYLRNTHKAELNPEGIKRDLQTLVQDPEVGLITLRQRFSQFDRDTLVKLLSQRQDLSEEQTKQILDQVESTWDNLVHTPQALANRAKEQYDDFTTRFADYLRNTNLEELNPEGIKRDLATLLDDPKAGTLFLRRRLSQIDRETLVKLLSQRQDLSEEQINQTLNGIQSAISQIIKTPRRLATRTQTQVQDFQANLENYLRNTDKDELNPESIKRDLHLLLKDPRLGIESLSDRLTKFDRSTLVALLAQRPDISEEEANRIASEIEAARNQFVEQVRSVQRRIQTVIDGIFGRIRKYLNSLERQELNYDGIRRDIRQLFSDPQAGFESLRDRLSHFNRDTLVAILSSRDDISEADAKRIIDQIEAARNNVLQRAERLQQSALARLEDLKHQAKSSAAETRKAAEIAAWWLFGTALTSAVLSAVAGAIAVIG
jgi:hypothetical protein